MKKNIKFSIILIIYSTFCSFWATAQDSSKPDLNPNLKGNIPVAPNAAALGMYGSAPVSLHSGTPSISIPLLSLTANKIALPVSLNYHASGVKVNQIASNVGLGWSLNAGGVITREVRDQPDDAKKIVMDLNFCLGGVLCNNLNSSNICGSCPTTNVGVPPPVCDYCGNLAVLKYDLDNVGYFYNGTKINEIYNDNNTSTANYSVADNQFLFGELYPDFKTANNNYTAFPDIIVKVENIGVGQNKMYYYRPILESKDTEPDMFSFNFGGYSGQFVFDKDKNIKIISDQDLKIEYTYNPTEAILGVSSEHSNLTSTKSMFEGAITSFTITTPNGYKYIFNEKEVSFSSSSGQTLSQDLNTYGGVLDCSPPNRFDREYTLDYIQRDQNRATYNAWYLSQVYNELGQLEYKLEYEKELMIDQSQVSESYNNCSKKVHATVPINMNLSKRLNKISAFTTDGSVSNATPSYTMEFIPDTDDRSDLYYTTAVTTLMGTNYKKLKALKSIQWKINDNGTFRLLKQFDFSYSYFAKTTLASTCTAPRDFVNKHRERLKLTAIQEIGSDGTTKAEPYTFTYDETPLPPRHSAHQDFWGFYNGDKSNTLLPQIYIYPSDPLTSTIHQTMYSSFKRENVATEYELFPTITTYGVHDRTSDGTKIKAGILTRITYPTKGWVNFDYEENEYDWPYVLSTGIRTKKGGGIRIQKITNSEGLEKTFNYSTTTNNVTLSNGKLIELPLFAKGNKVSCSGSVIADFLKNSAQVSSFSLVGMPTVVYDKVTEITKNNGKVVHTFNIPANYGVYTFTETNTNGNTLVYNAIGTIIRTNAAFPSTNHPSTTNDLFPFAPKPNLDWTRGLLLQKEYYDEAGTLLMKEENQYDLKNFVKIPALKVIADAQDPGKVENPFNVATVFNAMGKYYVLAGDKRIHKTIVTSYYKNAANTTVSVVKTVNYVYNTTTGTHHNPIEINFTNSDNKVHKTKIYYAQDIDVNHPNNATKSVFTNKYMIGIPLQVESYYGDNSKKKGSIIEYKDFGTGNKLFLPTKYYTIKSDGTKALNTTIDEYNTEGKPKKATQDGFTVSETYTWTNGLLTKKEFGALLNKQTLGYAYNTNRMLEMITDENGIKSKFAYDQLLRLNKSESKFANMTTATSPNVIGDVIYNFKTTTGDNFVKNTMTYKETTGDVKLINYQIVDGLGREIQAIREKYSATSALNNINQNSITYDIAGRPWKTYQPFESSATTYAAPASSVPYAITTYEPSPLSRPLTVTNEDNSTIKKIYGTNAANEVIDYAANAAGTNYFALNTLTKEETINENGDKVAIFKDLAGHLILSRRYTKSGSSPNFTYTTYADTYNVYDAYDNLVTIVPPGETVATTNQCFKYQYDIEHRLLKKTIPGMDDSYVYHYNDRDLLAIVQDPNQKASNKCIYTKYDEIGRVKDVALITYPTANITTASNTVNNSVAVPTADVLLSNTFYNNKSQLQKEQVKVGGTTFDYNYTYDSYGRLYTKRYTDPNGRAEDITTDYNLADKVTKVTRKHTDPNGTQHTIIDRYTYDHGLRAKGHFHKIDNQAETQLSLKNYTFKDQIAELNYGINSTSNQLQSIDYEYNTRGWLTGINKNTSKWISSANQLYYQCGNNYAPTNPVAVNVTGESLSPDAFMMELYYNEKDNGYLGSAKQYNGNIQAVTYQVFGVDRQSYGFAYDALDRMTRAQYGYLDNAGTLVFNSRYNESLSYDQRGNINTLNRNGTTGTCIITNPTVPSQQLPAFSFGPIDNLRYTYNATQKNRLESITESSSTAYGFKVKSGVVTSTAKYEYDKNGNLVKDPYKKITAISYNHLNLPEYIRFDESATSRSEISILYDAKGQKWSKNTRVMRLSNTTPAYWNIFSENTYYYDSGIEYRTGNSTAPNILQVEEGRMVWIAASGTTTGYYGYEYAIRDHLGNTRVMVSDRNRDNKIDMKTEIMQVNHYYPFGMNQDGPWLAGNSGDHKYQYNGKELNSEFGLDWLAYGARYYDAAVGRFPSVDPVIEKFAYLTPYNYASNEPVGMIDLHGLQGVKHTIIDATGNKSYIIELDVKLVTVDKWNKENGKHPKDRVTSTYGKDDVESVKKILNDSYNGNNGKGVKNSDGENVFFKFNVEEYNVGPNDKSDRAKLRGIARSQGVIVKNPDGTQQQGGNTFLLATYPGPGLKGLNLGNITLINTDQKEDPITTPHEIGHMLMNQEDPDKDHEMMGQFDFNLTPEVVDRMIEAAIPKNN